MTVNLFTAKPLDEGLSLFLLNQSSWFCRQFSKFGQKRTVSKNNSIQKSQEVKISFVQSRDQLFNLSVEEIYKSKASIDLLRSGQEIPAEVMLALVKARGRNIKTRMLIQDFNPENSEQVSFWKQNGIFVKKTNLRHIRLMIYDSKILYFMSYRHTDSDKDLGVKIDYPPFTTIISQLFNQWWQKASKID